MSTMINFLHIAATVVWIGGMIFMEAVLYPSLRVLEAEHGGKVQAVVAKRFSILAWSCLAILIVTGLLRTPSEWLLNTSFTEGTLLLIKHLLIIVAIINGIVITLVYAPRLISNTPKPGEKPAPVFINSQKQIERLAMIWLFLQSSRWPGWLKFSCVDQICKPRWLNRSLQVF